MWEPRRLTTLGAFTACYRDSFITLSTIGWAGYKAHRQKMKNACVLIEYLEGKDHLEELGVDGRTILK
jgi:hypothetical protein